MGRRCFSDKIVESDAFYQLPEGAQNLYFHLNMTADDDGFINNAYSVACRVKGGKKALKTLVEKRFLLEFSGGVFAVKHWRISNSLKNDRIKPLQYEGIAKGIWVRPNKAYTDHPVEGCKTLYEVKTGIKPEGNLESVWNPFGIPTEPNLTEPNRTEPNRTDLEARFSELWNAYPELYRGSEEEARTAFDKQIATQEDMETAIRMLDKWKASREWDRGYIPDLCNWLDRERWKNPPARSEDSIPRGASGELGEAELEAIRRVLAEDLS